MSYIESPLKLGHDTQVMCSGIGVTYEFAVETTVAN